MTDRHIEGGAPAGTDPRLRLSWEVNVGAMVQALAVLAGLITWLVTGQNKTAETQRNLDQMQQSVTAQITELRTALTGSLADVRRQIESLPDQRAQLEEMTRRLAEAAQARAALDARLGVVERTAIELRSDLNNIMRASSVPLPGSRR